MTGHRSWKDVKADMHKKFGCNCGHEGLDRAFHTPDCPYRQAADAALGDFEAHGITITDPPDPDRDQQEQAAADDIRAYYGGKPAPLPDGVTPADDDDAEEEEVEVEPADDKKWTTAELRSARSKAQGRAKTRLAHEFRMRYRMLYRIELEREGLTVRRHRRVGQPASKTIAREADTPQLRPAFPLPATEPDNDDQDN